MAEKRHIMKTIKISGRGDEQHHLSAEVPPNIAPGPVDLVLLVPSSEEDKAGEAWMLGIAREWADDLGDPRQDIYTLADGEPIDGAR
jgi:hypothetical protein